MSADWFCKINEKKVGPLNSQQLKTIVARGQLMPEHLVRRGSEGPWVPAGRIKGLFPEPPGGNTGSHGKKLPQATAKPLPKAAGTPPTAKPASLPTAAEAPVPPSADMPQELRLGGHHKHHVEMNVDNLHIEMTPVDVSRRKVKSGMRGLKKDEQKKLTIMLLCLIGGGTTFGVIVFIWAIASGKVFTAKPAEELSVPPALAQPADSGEKKLAKDSADKKPAAEKEPEWTRVSVKTLVGNVEVMVLKPTRGAPPQAAKVKETDVLIVPVRLNLKDGATKPVELKSWADESFQNKVSLRDDQKRSCDLLAQVADSGDGKTITENWLKVYLVFEAPADNKFKFLHLKLPASAFQAKGPVMGFEINPGDIHSEAAKGADTDKADNAAKSDEGVSGASTSKSDKKKPSKAKADAGADSK